MHICNAMALIAHHGCMTIFFEFTNIYTGKADGTVASIVRSMMCALYQAWKQEAINGVE